MARTLLDKVWEAHTVRTLPSGQTQLLIGLHLVHEVTTPQAFQMLKDAGLQVRMPERTFATIDHIIPTAGPGSAPTPTRWRRRWRSTASATRRTSACRSSTSTAAARGSST